jgi:hypothetical protein
MNAGVGLPMVSVSNRYLQRKTQKSHRTVLYMSLDAESVPDCLELEKQIFQSLDLERWCSV